MRKRSTKERVMPLVVNSGITAISLGVANILFKKADKAVEEKKSFKAGVLGGLGVALSTAGSICGTFGTIFTGANALIKYEYTDEEIDSILD